MHNFFRQPEKWERRLFYFVVLLTTVFIFYPSYLPMVDLPQHAGQVATLNDLLHHQSVWAHLLELNWDTPYLVGYGLWLALYQVFDIVLSAKILVAFTFLFYTYAINLFRKSFQSTIMIEWVAMTTFFGFAFQWGFITYLLSIPIGILFLLSCKKWLENHCNGDYWRFAILGVVMYFCHILIFAFFCFLSYGYFLLVHAKSETWKQRILFTAPYIVYAGILLRYIFKPKLWSFRYYSQDYVFISWLEKMENLRIYPWNMGAMPYYELAALALLLLPPFLGYRLQRQIKYYVLLIGFLMIWYVMPHIGFQTGFLYQRFAIFFVPFYYLIWKKREYLGKRATDISQLAYVFFVISIGALMVKVYLNQIYFEQEPSVKAFQIINEKMLPEKRVLNLLTSSSRHSEYLTSQMEYLYFANWYQAKKRGWVDFNFASFHPQIVHYREGKTPILSSRSAEKGGIAALNNCNDYDYLVMKSSESVTKIVTWLNANPYCQYFKLIVHESDWIIFIKQGD